MIPVNFTPTPGWSSFNQTLNDCGQVYLDAYQAVKNQLGIYIIYLAIAIVIQAVCFRLWEKNKISTRRFQCIMTITILAELMWVFNLIGMYYLGM